MMHDDTVDFDPDNFIMDAQGSDTFIQDYVERRISEIPSRGDAARWAIAEYCYQSFDWEPNRDGTLTDQQRAEVDAFVSNYTKQ